MLKTIHFNEIQIGDKILYCNSIFIKTEDSENKFGKFNAINILTGTTIYIDKNTVIIRILYKDFKHNINNLLKQYSKEERE